jgi:hypothetical protein
MVTALALRLSTYAAQHHPLHQTATLTRLGIQQRDQSMLTFETSAIQGVAGIIEKLTVSSADTHPTSISVSLQSQLAVSAQSFRPLTNY